jgi:tripartite-type tricarboxylate transporter receptor subunit TctC
MIIDLMPSAISHVRSGKLRALAVTSPQCSKVAPDLATVAEAGVPGYEFVGWFGILAPSKTPPEVVKKLNTALNDVLRDETLRQKLLEQGAEPNAGAPEQFRSHLRKETERWARLVKDAKLPPLD